MSSFIRQRVKINHTLDRDKAWATPTDPDDKCPYFHQRFIGHGVMNERRAICGSDDPNIACDYQHTLEDGTPFCLRYWYGPMYEVQQEVPEPQVQKKSPAGSFLYYDENGEETTTPTTRPVLLPVTKHQVIPYLEKTKVQERNQQDQLLFWDESVTPMAKTTIDTGVPVMINTKPDFFSSQHEDTHGKIFDVIGNRLGWHFDL